MVERHVHGDSAEPVLERGAAVELRERTPDLEERLLGEVFEPVMIALIAIENGEDVRLVAADEFGELIVRAVSDSLQQFGIVVHYWGRIRRLRRFTQKGNRPVSFLSVVICVNLRHLRIQNMFELFPELVVNALNEAPGQSVRAR